MDGRLLGTYTVKLDGKELPAEAGNGELDIGGELGTIAMGSRGPVGARVKNEPSKGKFKLLPTAEVNFKDFQTVKQAALEFEGNDGRTFVVAKAWLTSRGGLKDGDDSGMDLEFTGTPAEEVKHG